MALFWCKPPFQRGHKADSWSDKSLYAIIYVLIGCYVDIKQMSYVQNYITDIDKLWLNQPIDSYNSLLSDNIVSKYK